MVLNIRHWAFNLISLCRLPENHKTRLTVLQIQGIYFACPSWKEHMENILRPKRTTLNVVGPTSSLQHLKPDKASDHSYIVLYQATQARCVDGRGAILSATSQCFVKSYGLCLFKRMLISASIFRQAERFRLEFLRDDLLNFRLEISAIQTPSAEVNASLYFSAVLQVLCSLCEVQRGTAVRVEPKSENTALRFLQQASFYTLHPPRSRHSGRHMVFYTSTHKKKVVII